jgi:hypothetical protein
MLIVSDEMCEEVSVVMVYFNALLHPLGFLIRACRDCMQFIDCGLLVCDTLSSCRWIPTLRSNIVPPSLGLEHSAHPEDEHSITLTN